MGCPGKHVGDDDVEPIRIEPKGEDDPRRVLRIERAVDTVMTGTENAVGRPVGRSVGLAGWRVGGLDCGVTTGKGRGLSASAKPDSPAAAVDTECRESRESGGGSDRESRESGGSATRNRGWVGGVCVCVGRTGR